jgi:hypothetical protein
VEVDWREKVGETQYLLFASDGTGNNAVIIYNTTGSTLQMLIAANNATVVSQGVSTSGFSGIQKIAFAYADSDFELYRNGASAVDSTSGSLASLATLTDIDLGQGAFSNLQANMWIRSAALFTRRLSDAECIALTTL